MIPHIRKLGALVTAILALAIVAGCGSSSSKTAASKSTSSPKAPITVVAVGDESGPTKEVDLPHLSAVEGAAAYFNAHGGIDGHHVVVQILDDDGDPTTAAAVVIKRLSSGSLPTAISAGNEGNEAAALIPVLKRYDVFALTTQDPQYQCLTAGATNCPNEFTLTPSVQVEQVPVASWLKARGIKKVGLLDQQIDFTEQEVPVFKKAAAADGISTTVATFPATAVDLTPEMDALKSAGAQAVYVLALGPPVGYSLKARSGLGWNVPILFDPAAAATGPASLVSAALYKNSWEDIPFVENPATTAPAIQDMIQYSKPYLGGVTVAPLTSAADGWDILVDLNDAVKAAGGSLSTKALDAGILHIPTTDPLRLFSRELGFTAADHDNTLSQADDYGLVPVAPMVDGRIAK